MRLGRVSESTRNALFSIGVGSYLIFLVFCERLPTQYLSSSFHHGVPKSFVMFYFGK